MHDGVAVVEVGLRQAGHLGDVVLQLAEDAGPQVDRKRVQHVAVLIDLGRADLDDLAAQHLLDPVIVERVGLIADVPFQIKYY